MRLHTKVCISFCLDAASIFLQFKWLDKSFLVALAYFVIRWAHEKLTIVGFLHARKYKRRKRMRWEKPSTHRTRYSNWKTLFCYLKILAYKLILPGIKILQVRGAHFEKRMRELLPDRIHNSYYCIGPEVVKKKVSFLCTYVFENSTYEEENFLLLVLKIVALLCLYICSSTAF